MKSALTAPKGLISIGGQFVPRRMGYRGMLEAIVDRRGHRIERTSRVADGFGYYPCHTPGCSEVVLVFASPGCDEFRADVTESEYREMLARHFTRQQASDYIGARLPDPHPEPDNGQPTATR